MLSNDSIVFYGILAVGIISIMAAVLAKDNKLQITSTIMLLLQ